MLPSVMLSILLAAGLDEARDIEPDHTHNAVYVEAIETGLTVDGETVALPPPILQDGQGPEEQREVLLELVGSERALENFLRDSVTAPFVLKTRDVRTDSSIIRVVDLWFVARADLDEFDPDEAAREVRGETVEAANMRFSSRILDKEDLEAAALDAAEDSSEVQTWYARIEARLLDRIALEATSRADLTRATDSIVIASRTESDLGPDSSLSTRWRALETRARSDSDDDPDAFQAYQGGISYSKISRLEFEPGALLVESHLAFVEPLDWFRGAPILRSKFSVIAQDQVRQLRREIARKRSR